MKNTMLFLVSLLVVGCQSKVETTAENKVLAENIVTLSEAQLKNASLSTGTLEKRTMASVLKVNGQIDVPPQNLVSISMPLGGYLKIYKVIARHAYQQRRNHCDDGRPTIRAVAARLSYHQIEIVLCRKGIRPPKGTESESSQ
jgi:hypothetical protein